MQSILQNIFRAGIGLTRLRKEDIEKVFNELKKRGEVVEEERDLFITRTLQKLGEAGKAVTESIKKTLNPNLERLEALNAKIDELIKEFEALKKKRKNEKPEQ